jgi:Alpha/beta hydrolase domain containing 18
MPVPALFLASDQRMNPVQGETTDSRLNGVAGDGARARAHPVDVAVAWLSRRSGLFSRGWGDESVLAEFSNRARYLAAPAPVKIEWHARRRRGRAVCRDGTFPSPLTALPDAAQTVHVRACSREGNVAACVLLAASRDEGYRIRERVFGTLTERGIGLYPVENPYYGLRRDGLGPSDITVGDHGLMALGMVLEARALLDNLHARYQKLAVRRV